MDSVPLLVLGCGIRRDTGMALPAPRRRPARDRAPGRPRPVPARARRGHLPDDPPRLPPRAGGHARSRDGRDPGQSLPLHARERRPRPRTGRADRLSASDADLDRVASLLAKARRPLLYLGLGAQAGGRDLSPSPSGSRRRWPRRSRARASSPSRTRSSSGPASATRRRPSCRRSPASATLTLAIGCRFGEVATGSYGLKPPAPLVHVDIEPAVIGRNFKAEVGIAADAAAFVPGTAHADSSCRTGRTPSCATRIARGHEERAAANGVMQRRRDARHARVVARRRCNGASAGAPSSRPTAATGRSWPWRCLRLDHPRQFLAPVDYSCMGYCVPAAIGAKLACAGSAGDRARGRRRVPHDRARAADRRAARGSRSRCSSCATASWPRSRSSRRSP